VTVVMMAQMSQENWVEKSEKKNEQDYRLTELGMKFIPEARSA